MKVIISRASDQFMQCEHPNPRWKPFPTAVWDGDKWVMEIESLEQLTRICDKDSQLVLKRDNNKISIEIDDVSAFLNKPVQEVY